MSYLSTGGRVQTHTTNFTCLMVMVDYKPSIIWTATFKWLDILKLDTLKML